MLWKIAGYSALVVALLLIVGSAVVFYWILPRLLSASYAIDNECAAIETQITDCLAEGRLDDALEHANSYVERFGGDACFGEGAYSRRAQVHARRNELESAIQDLTTVMERSSPTRFSDWMRVIARGRCYERAGMQDAAARDYQQVYDSRVAEYTERNSREPNHPSNYMDVIDNFSWGRGRADEEFAFDPLQFERVDASKSATQEYREAKRHRREATLNWLRSFVDVHAEIVDNIHDVDAKVYSLAEVKEPG